MKTSIKWFIVLCCGKRNIYILWSLSLWISLYCSLDLCVPWNLYEIRSAFFLFAYNYSVYNY